MTLIIVFRYIDWKKYRGDFGEDGENQGPPSPSPSPPPPHRRTSETLCHCDTDSPENGRKKVTFDAEEASRLGVEKPRRKLSEGSFLGNHFLQPCFLYYCVILWQHIFCYFLVTRIHFLKTFFLCQKLVNLLIF